MIERAESNSNLGTWMFAVVAALRMLLDEVVGTWVDAVDREMHDYA